MSERNTIDILGDNVAASKLIDKSITMFVDDTLKKVGHSGFYGCSVLTSVSLPAATFIDNSAFRGCSALTTVILGNTSQVVTLSSGNAFVNSDNAIFYVPDALVDSYKAATNWSSLASRIKGISELPE